MKTIILFTIIFCTTLTLNAQPNLSSKKYYSECSCIILKDDTLVGAYYYLPTALKIAKDGTGKPELKFIRAVYEGTRKNRDLNSSFNFQQLSFTIEFDAMDIATLDTLKSLIGEDKSITPLPLKHIDAKLVLPMAEGNFKWFNEGYFEPNKDKLSNWTRRKYTLNLNLKDGILLWDNLKNGQSGISLTYRIYADVVENRDSSYKYGLLSIPGELRPIITNAFNSENSDQSISTQLVYANTLNIAIDTIYHHDVFNFLNLNAPGATINYPVLNILFEDFINEVATDLYEREVEIEAEGFSNTYYRSVFTKMTFDIQHPEDYLKKIQFQYPVRTDRPFKVKITDHYYNADENVFYSKTIGPYLVRDWGVLNLSSRK